MQAVRSLVEFRWLNRTKRHEVREDGNFAIEEGGSEGSLLRSRVYNLDRGQRRSHDGGKVSLR